MADAFPGLVCLADFRAAARRRLSPAAFAGIDGAAGAGQTMRANEEAFGRYGFRPRLLTDVSTRDCGVTLFGRRLELPVLLAPVAPAGPGSPEQVCAAARAAHRLGSALVLAIDAAATLEQVAAAAPGGASWLQVYPGDPRDDTLRRAAAAGYRVLVVTVDAKVPAGRVRPGATWADVRELRDAWSGQLVVKGILTAEDTREAIAHGADGVICSNHGGRLLDGDPPSLHALPRVVEAASRTSTAVLIDGGIRTGGDVVKALALGARACLIGRPYWWGLAAGGEQGAAAVLDILKKELESTMTQLGLSSSAAINRGAIEALPL